MAQPTQPNEEQVNKMLARNTHHTGHGFTLIELMIIIAVVGFLLVLGTPMYLDSITKSRRADGMRDLMELASRQERYYAQNGTYAGDVLDLDASNLDPDDPTIAISSEGFYELDIAQCLEGGVQVPYTRCYMLLARPRGAQESDTQCATLSVDRLGQRNASGPRGEKCW